MDREALISAMQTAAQRVAVLTEVDVPEWGGKVFVKKLTVADIEAMPSDARDGENAIARGLARVVTDANGDLMFDETDADDVALIASQPQEILIRLQRGTGEAPAPKNE